MTPKEKAEELLNKFSMPIDGHKNIYYKQCALIAIDEIMKVVSFYNDTQAEYYYWEEVQEEIEKL